MLIKDKIQLYNFPKNINFLYSRKLSCLFIYNMLGIYTLYLPSYYFYNLSNYKIVFIFLKYFFYQSFLKHLFVISNKLTIFYFFRIRIKGLGFRIRSISDVLYYFFFNYTNFFYFYPPESLLIRVYKKRMLLISFDWFLLKLVLSHILLLRKIGPYSFLGLRYKRQIVLLKKSGKKV